MLQSRVCFFVFFFFASGLQHDVIHPGDPFGLPLEYSILPQELKKVGKSLISSTQPFWTCFILRLSCVQCFSKYCVCYSKKRLTVIMSKEGEANRWSLVHR